MLPLPINFHITVSYTPPHHASVIASIRHARFNTYEIALFQLHELGDAFVLVHIVEISDDAFAVCGTL
jgi:hypothetical protein